MNINLTLFGQTISFLLFAVFCMKFVWPVIREAMETREKLIADGLAAADKAGRDLEIAQAEAAEFLNNAKQDVSGILDQANKRASKIVEDAKAQADEEADRLKSSATAEIDQERNRAKEQLRQQVSGLAVAGAEKILGKEIDENQHKALVEDLIKSL